MRTPRRSRRHAVLLIALATIALGCATDLETPASTDHEAPAAPDDPTRDTPRPGSEPGSGPGSEAESEASPDPFEPPLRPEPSPDVDRPGACDAATAAAIGSVVSMQLEAFTRDDLDAAYALTSPFFQRIIERDAFEELIRTDYPYLLESSGHRLTDCWARSRRGYILAGVRVGTREVVLRYDVSDEPDSGWRIDGAAELPGISLPDDQLV